MYFLGEPPLNFVYSLTHLICVPNIPLLRYRQRSNHFRGTRELQTLHLSSDSERNVDADSTSAITRLDTRFCQEHSTSNVEHSWSHTLNWMIELNRAILTLQTSILTETKTGLRRLVAQHPTGRHRMEQRLYHRNWSVVGRSGHQEDV